MGKKNNTKKRFPKLPPPHFFCNALIFSIFSANILNGKREIFYDLNTGANNVKYTIIF